MRGVRDAGSLRFPEGGVLWRGGALPDQHQAFYAAGVRYRVPIATQPEIDSVIISSLPIITIITHYYILRPSDLQVRYRVPGFLATSASQGVTYDFIYKARCNRGKEERGDGVEKREGGREEGRNGVPGVDEEIDRESESKRE